MAARSFGSSKKIAEHVVNTKLTQTLQCDQLDWDGDDGCLIGEEFARQCQQNAKG